MNNKIDSFTGRYFFLSNFFNAPVQYEGLTYINNEAAFQSAKVVNIDQRKQFCELDPSRAKRKGRSVILRHNWEKIKDQVMYDVCMDKFTRNPELKQKLIDTGDAILIEGNDWNDTYWGVCRGIGKNMLGKTLMKIREELKLWTSK